MFFCVAASAAAGAVLAARYSCRFLRLCAVAAHGDSRVCGCEEHVVFAPLDDGGELRLPLNIYIYIYILLSHTVVVFVHPSIKRCENCQSSSASRR